MAGRCLHHDSAKKGARPNEGLLGLTGSPERWVWVAVLVITLSIAMSADVRVVEVLITNTNYVGDFTVFWTAARID